METPATEATVEAQGAPEQTTETVDQQGYINDAFGDYFGSQEEKTDETQAQEPKKNEKQAQTPKGDETQGKDPKQDAKEAEAAKKPDPFETAFTTEGGMFDLEKLVGVSLDGLQFQSEPAQENKPGKPEEAPAWQKEFEAEKTYRDNITKSRLGPLESIYNEINSSDLPDEYKGPILNLINGEYVRIRGENEQHFKERDAQNAHKSRSEEQERLRDEMRSAKLPELAKVNAMAVISKLPGNDNTAKIELYNRIMFGPGAGGELLEDMFLSQHPDFAGKTKDEQNRMKMKFVNELQADGKRLQRHFDRAYRYLIADPKNMRRIMEQVSNKTEANVRSNALAAQKTPSGSVERQPQAGTSKWDGYFAAPEGAKIRV